MSIILNKLSRRFSQFEEEWKQQCQSQPSNNEENKSYSGEPITKKQWRANTNTTIMFNQD